LTINWYIHLSFSDLDIFFSKIEIQTLSLFMTTIGQKIRKIREIIGYSQAYVAKKIGISQKRYSYMENKQKTISGNYIKALAGLYHIPEEFILTFDPENIINYSDHTHADISGDVLSELKQIEQKLDQLISIISSRNRQIN
jgi:transcriptional regulator with XRE-family HTH domain